MNALFIHIPKTAGCSVTAALSMRRIGEKYAADETFEGRYTFKHRLYEDIPDRAKSAFTITFVRDPYDRAVSIWSFMKPDIPFVDFLERNKNRMKKGRIFMPQWSWIEGVPYDYIGFFECLQDDIRILIKAIDAPPLEGANHMNKTLARPTESPYCKRSRALVQEMYAIDFEKLGYPT